MTTPSIDTAAASTDGRRIADRYLLHEALGRGGMGRVYRAHDEMLDRTVAVKLIYGDTVSDAELQRACATEARAAARLNHPGIVRILDSGVDDGQCYVVMELASGASLATILAQRGPLPVAEALPIARQAADALQAAHDAGVIHCDVKPANLMVSVDGRVQLVDFGIARVATATTGLLDATLQGSARYVAPEQVEGGKLDGRTDVYALGIVLYEMLAGQAPFDGGSLASILARRLVVDPPPVRQLRPDVPAAVESVVMQALARVPADRYPSAGAFRDALDGVRSGRTAAVVAQGRGVGMVPVSVRSRALSTIARTAEGLAALRPRTVAVLAAVLVASILASMIVARLGVATTTAEAATASTDLPPVDVTSRSNTEMFPPAMAVQVPPTDVAPTAMPSVAAPPPDDTPATTADITETTPPAVEESDAVDAPSEALVVSAPVQSTTPRTPRAALVPDTAAPRDGATDTDSDVPSPPADAPAESGDDQSPPEAAQSAPEQPERGARTGNDNGNDNRDDSERTRADRQRAPAVEVLKTDPPPATPKPAAPVQSAVPPPAPPPATAKPVVVSEPTAAPKPTKVPEPTAAPKPTTAQKPTKVPDPTAAPKPAAPPRSTGDDDDDDDKSEKTQKRGNSDKRR